MPDRSTDSPATSVLIALLFFGLYVLVPVQLAWSRMRGAAESQPVTPRCVATHRAAAGDTIESVSRSYYGDPSYAWAIVLATNELSDSPPYGYVNSPFSLPLDAALCVPERATAEALERRFDAYLRAGREAMLPRPNDGTHPLLELDPKKPTRFSTWVRKDQVAHYQPANGAPTRVIPQETWVTAAPELQEFCRAFVASHRPTPDELALRLEQRLGLPPGSKKVAFVEFEIAAPQNDAQPPIFRPCSDRTVDKGPGCTLQAAPTPEKFQSFLAAHRAPGSTLPTQHGGSEPPAPSFESWYWFLERYYRSYGTATPFQYPWTASGYTFDWAPRVDDSEQFQKWGETEFVVAGGAEIGAVTVTDTVRYCEPR